MDLVGRRIPITIGLMNGGVMLIIVTFTQQIYPGVLICLILLSLSGSAAVDAPLMIDYVKPKSYGINQML
jgi:hypothetical protein